LLSASLTGLASSMVVAEISTRTESVPTFCTLGSLAPASSTVPRTSDTDRPWALAWKTVPPLNSTPRSRPRTPRPTPESNSRIRLATKYRLRLPMMLNDFSPLCSRPPRSVRRDMSGLPEGRRADAGQRGTPLHAQTLRADPGPLLTPGEVRPAHQQRDHRLG